MDNAEEALPHMPTAQKRQQQQQSIKIS